MRPDRLTARCFIAARDARAKVAAVSCIRHPVLSARNTPLLRAPSFDSEKRHDEVEDEVEDRIVVRVPSSRVCGANREEVRM